MLTVSPDVASTSPPCTDDVVVGDPECGWRLVAPTLHTCTARDGETIGAGSDKACFAWARHQLRTARLCTDCTGDTTDARCGTCDGSGVALVNAAALPAFASPHDQRDHIADAEADVDEAPAPAGPDNVIYGSPSGNPSFHYHTRQAELGCHQHFGADAAHCGTAPHHHDGADPEAWLSPTVTVHVDQLRWAS